MLVALVVSQICSVIAFLVVLYKLEQAHNKERQELLQRIQAPSVAVAQHAPPAESNPLQHSVEPDDDVAYFEYLQEIEDAKNL